MTKTINLGIRNYEKYRPLVALDVVEIGFVQIGSTK